MNTTETLIAVHLCQFKLTLSDIIPFIVADYYNKIKNDMYRSWDSSYQQLYNDKLTQIQHSIDCCNAIEGGTSNTRFRKFRPISTDFNVRKYKGYVDWKDKFEAYISACLVVGLKIEPLTVKINRDLEYHEKLLLSEINSTKHGVILII